MPFTGTVTGHDNWPISGRFWPVAWELKQFAQNGLTRIVWTLGSALEVHGVPALDDQLHAPRLGHVTIPVLVVAAELPLSTGI
jgi:hypothetical protein